MPETNRITFSVKRENSNTPHGGIRFSKRILKYTPSRRFCPCFPRRPAVPRLLRDIETTCALSTVLFLRSRTYEITNNITWSPLPHGSVFTNCNSGRARSRRTSFDYYETVCMARIPPHTDMLSTWDCERTFAQHHLTH